MATEPEESASTQLSTTVSMPTRLFRKLSDPVIKKVKGFDFKAKLSQLTVSQLFYFSAFIVFLFLIQDEEEYFESSVIWVGALASMGLVRELWFLFNKVWEKNFGKAIVILLYAATANIALAVAAMKINAITGIEPNQFVFTLAFTTLLTLPFWLLTASVLFFSVTLVVLNLWLVLSIMLRLVRIKIKVHWEDQSFVFLTMVLRLVLIPSILISLSKLIVPYAEQMEFIDPQNQSQNIQSLKDDIQANVKEEDIASNPLLFIHIGKPNEELDKDIAIATEANDKDPFINIIVANFIYWFEAYPKSMCYKSDNQRSFVIDENSVLLVEPDDSDLGYTFSVAACRQLYLEAQ